MTPHPAIAIVGSFLDATDEGKINRSHDKLPNESNWDMCIRKAKLIDKTLLIQCLLKQIEAMGKRGRMKVPLWSYVGEATSHGCGISTAIVNLYLPPAAEPEKR